MNYSALIQNRKSVREFSYKNVPVEVMEDIKRYYGGRACRLIPELNTELRLFGLDARTVLEGAAGYKSFLIGSPQYMVLLSEKHPQAGLNAGFIMEDLILKLADMGLDSCWLTFTDSDFVKAALEIESDLEVAAIAAFGYGEKTTRRLRVNVRSMSNVDIAAQRQYFAPKHGIHDMVFLNSWGSTEGVDEFIGFYDDMLWEALYAAAQAPSYLNRQPYGFVIHEGQLVLVEVADEYTGEIDAKLNLGIVLLHFTAVAAQWAGRIRWEFGKETGLQLPEGYKAVAACVL